MSSRISKYSLLDVISNPHRVINLDKGSPNFKPVLKPKSRSSAARRLESNATDIVVVRSDSGVLTDKSPNEVYSVTDRRREYPFD